MAQSPQISPHRLPAAATWLLRPLPLLPLRLFLQRLAASIARRHPQLHERLEAYRGRGIGVQPTDVPFSIIIEPCAGGIALRIERGLEHGDSIATIRGTLLALLGLLDGSYDGDALFFSRDIAIDGDIGAVLALRNAVDDAQIDLLREVSACFGPFAVTVADSARALVAQHRRMPR